ncbi:STAS domain-containing protein [Lentzea sp. BCCO 10_0798]|uniref:Anti-sigma factor antagonist n=2 Tax=Lentzea TaxID=165301 RepID=A0ABU4TKE2_9PSEU|nr:STAS domain-containing protein [Lentzea sp. BCCO 10_0798]MDX8048707.1 STAS domain-containing protein [Lentzea sp. BCCO 10_0798]
MDPGISHWALVPKDATISGPSSPPLLDRHAEVVLGRVPRRRGQAGDEGRLGRADPEPGADLVHQLVEQRDLQRRERGDVDQRVRDAEHLGGDLAAVLAGLAHDDVGTPGAGEVEDVGGGRDHERAGPERHLQHAVAFRDPRWRRPEVGRRRDVPHHDGVLQVRHRGPCRDHGLVAPLPERPRERHHRRHQVGVDGQGRQKNSHKTSFAVGSTGYSCEMLEVTVTESSPASTLVTVSGELAGSGSERLLARLDRLLDNGHRYVVLDLTAVTFCDSSGVSALVRGHARASAAAGGLKLAAASEQVTRVLELSGLARMLGLQSTVEA